jgi:hypothetical protein
MSRPRTFAWVAGLRGPEPQIIYEDPRTGCAGLPIMATHKIDSDYPHSIALLRRRFPAPREDAAPLTPPSQG